jgi:hypothetical protein
LALGEDPDEDLNNSTTDGVVLWKYISIWTLQDFQTAI